MKKIAVLFLCLIMFLCTGCTDKATSSDSGKANGDYIVSKGDYGAGLKMKNLKNKKLRVAADISSLDSIAVLNRPNAPYTAYQVGLSWKETYGVEIEYDAITTKDLIAAYATDNMPDIVQFSASNPPEIFMDLTEVIDFNDELYHTEFNELLKWTGNSNRVIGVKRLQRKYIIFNETRFINEGQKTPLEWYKEGKWTFTQFKNTAKAMTNPNNDQYALTGNEFTTQLVPYGVINWDENGKLSLDLKNSKFVLAATELSNLSSIDKVFRGGNKSANWREEFPKGQDAMVIGNEYEYSEICRKAKLAGGDDFGVAPMFVWDITGETEPFYATSSMSASISSKSKNVEGAVEYLRLISYVNNQMCERLGLFGSAEQYLTEDEREALLEQEKAQIIVKANSFSTKASELLKTATTSGSGVVAKLDSIKPQLQQEIDEYNSKK